MLITRAWFLVAVMFLSADAVASPLTYHVEGEVSRFFRDPFQGVALGDEIDLYFTFDPDQPPILIGSQNADYPIIGWELTIGTLSASSPLMPDFSQSRITKSAGELGYFSDAYSLTGEVITRTEAGYEAFDVLAQFRDRNEPNVPLDPALLLDPTDFDRYEETELAVTHYGNIDNGEFSHQGAAGIIRSITVVPEPSSAFLMVIGLTALCCTRLRRPRTR